MAELRIAEPSELAHLLREQRECVLVDWEREARRLPKVGELQAPWLLDRIPDLVEELAQVLASSDAARAEALRIAIEHGQHRLAVGFRPTELIEEYRILRQCVFDLGERHGLALVGPARAILNGFIDRSVSASVQAYIDRRDEDERRRRQEYLSFIVHDLRSPLSAIYQGIAVIESDLKRLPVSERAWAMLSAVRRNIQRMRALIVKVLQEEANIRASNNVEVQPRPVDLRTVVESVVRTLEPLASSNETQVRDAVPPGLTVAGDPALLERVFQNLVSNAIDYAPRGHVTIDCTRLEDGRGIACQVSDDGPGIPDELRERIFDNGYTDPHRRGGIGLGLAIVRRLVEAHGGRIEVETAPGKGTVFRLVLPSWTPISSEG